MSDQQIQPEGLHWGIVGGGMLGLTLALRLARQGERVTLLEAAPEIGGLASAWQLGDITWDRHYHVTLLSDTHTRELLDELALDQEMKWVETKTGFFTEGKLVSMSNSLEFLRFPPLNLIEKFRLGSTIFYASRIRNWKPLESILVADWLRKWSGRSTFEKIWLPLLKAKLGETYKRVSAAFIWATIARMYKARRSGLKKEMFGYLPGGYARVLERLAAMLEKLGVEIKPSQTVKLVHREADGSIRVDCRDSSSLHFDRVVVTAPSAVVSKLCPQLEEEQRQRHEQIEYLGILCASVLLKQPLAHYYVTNITDSWVPFTAVIEMTALVDPRELDNNHLIYLPRYVASDDAAWLWTDDEVQERFLVALERMYPNFSRDEVQAFRVSRVKHVMALPTVDYSEHLPGVATSLENIYFVNSAQIVKGTLNVNEVIELADDIFQKNLLPSLASRDSGVPLPPRVPQDNEQNARELVPRP